MIPTSEDFEVYQGNSKRIVFKTSGINDLSKIDEIHWYVVYNINEDDVILQKSYPGEINIEVDKEDSSIYNIFFMLNENDTLNLEPRKYDHELKLEDTDLNEAFVSTISRGEFVVKDSVNT